ncbi:MAG: acetylglutamate kinase [Bacteroidetes bacterium]|nr:acetylglutamate kinase [Bacteroidota bacterium]
MTYLDKFSYAPSADKYDATGLKNSSRQKLFVVKVGGNIIDDNDKLSSFLHEFSKIFVTTVSTAQSYNAVLVHGGGKIATDTGNKLGITSKYINGRRVTDDATIDLVTMVYGGLVNKRIVAQLQSLHCNAIGLTGADANIIPAKKRPPKKIANSNGSEEMIDFGWVGDIDQSQLQVENLEKIIAAGFVPVLAPLTHDGMGHILNTNADTIAATIAIALSKLYDVRLIYCFEKKGVLENVADDNSVIPRITKEKYKQLIRDKKLFEGILPKIENAFAAIDAGVHEVLIGDAGDLIQNTSANAMGTLITA